MGRISTIGSGTGRGWRLWYECASLPFRVPKDLPCHRQDVGGVTVFEQHRNDPSNPYGLRFERFVRTQSELNSAKTTVFDLEKQLRRVWPYVAGAPMTIRQSQIVFSADGPSGWRTNHRELYQQIPGARLNLTVAQGVRDFGITLPSMPLKAALDALPAFRDADPVTSTLIDLHLDTWGHYQHGVEIFLYAKTLELAIALLPPKQKTLPKDCADHMTRSLSWLVQIANTRIEARHAVQKSRGKSPQLHPRLNQEERLDFINNADVAIRGVISNRLGVDLNTIKRDK